MKILRYKGQKLRQLYNNKFLFLFNGGIIYLHLKFCDKEFRKFNVRRNMTQKERDHCQGKNSGMKREEKSNNIRNTIIEVSGKLFVEQGYQKTTIRQIAEKAGIKIGTIYHFFRDKEDIILKHSNQIDLELMAHVEKIMEDPNDFILKYALYRALEFKIVEKYDKIAELYLESYNSWRMTQMIVPRNMQRKMLFFHEYNENFTKKDYYKLSLALRGMRQIHIAERVHTGINRFKEHTPFIIETALIFFNVPKQKRDTAIVKAMDIAKDKQGKLYGSILGYTEKGPIQGQS